MNKQHLHIILFLLALVFSNNKSQAQIYLNRGVEFTSLADSAKIENLYTINDSSAAVNVVTAQSNKLLYAQVSGSNNLLLTLPISSGNITKGNIVYFKANSTNTDSVTISINGSPAYSLYKNINFPLIGGDIQAGQMIVVGFDGSRYQFMNYTNNNCPTGFLPVTNEYCIEQNESTSIDTFYNAVVDCYSKNARLCNWGEWHYACVKLGASLSNMTNNWEYTDDPGNEIDMVRICGNGSCTAAGLQDIPINVPKKYRCCYSRK